LSCFSPEDLHQIGDRDRVIPVFLFFATPLRRGASRAILAPHSNPTPRFRATFPGLLGRAFARVRDRVRALAGILQHQFTFLPGRGLEIPCKRSREVLVRPVMNKT
jgi:hypothetical protein